MYMSKKKYILVSVDNGYTTSLEMVCEGVRGLRYLGNIKEIDWEVDYEVSIDIANIKPTLNGDSRNESRNSTGSKEI